VGIVTLYGIRNCDTVKKARAWLDARGIEYRFHDYKASGADVERLQQWAHAVGWEALLNRAGTTFRKLPDRDKEDLSATKALSLMSAHPALIRRPVLELGGRFIVG
jgi:arsenate reductase (glutaredoxin)